MLRIFFTTDDLVRTTVAAAADPLWEAVLGARRLRERDHPRTLGHCDPALRLLYLPTPPPDLLTPPESAAGLEEGLDAVRRTPAHRVRAELGRLGPLPSWAVPLAEGDPRALAELSDGLRRLHSLLVEPQAKAVRESVAADRARRARDLVEGGVHGLLSGLRPHARWHPPVLLVEHPADRTLHLRGRGLRLIPSYFCRHRPSTLTDPTLPPVLVYPIDETDRWCGDRRRGLDDLLGTTRRAVLECARTGLGTTELARRVGTSAASVSRHTGVLRAAGLLRSTRQGAKTVHSLTTLGEALLTGHPL